MTFFKNRETHASINALYNEVQKHRGFFTITEGAGEITIIFDNCFSALIDKKITEKPHYKNTTVASIGVKFSEKYLETPGLLYLILQQIVLQQINIIELSSTATEFMIYIDQKETRIAFDTLYNRFFQKKAIYDKTNLAGAEGIEPSTSVLETDVIPLNYAPILP